MKQLFTLLAITLFGAATWSCSYDDDDLWKEIDGIKTQLAELNKEVSALQTLVDALRQSKTISDVTQTDTGYTITFNDNTSVSIADGKDGTNARRSVSTSSRGLLLDDRRQGQLADRCGRPQNPGSWQRWFETEMAVDADGYWIVDGARIKDAAGNDVKRREATEKTGIRSSNRSATATMP
ncbi:MAG: PL29 family lyase N-terminal domain-containing protein [Alistipes sp.]